MMDVASAKLVLQLQVEDNEGLLAATDSHDDFHAALTLHVSDLRERLQVLQDHSEAYRPLGAVGQETVDGVFGPYHTPSPSQTPPQDLSIPAVPQEEAEARQPTDQERQREPSDLADALIPVHPSVNNNSQAASLEMAIPVEVRSSKRARLSEDEEDDFSPDFDERAPKRNKLTEDVLGHVSVDLQMPSDNAPAARQGAELHASGGPYINFEPDLQPEAAETFHDAVDGEGISDNHIAAEVAMDHEVAANTELAGELSVDSSCIACLSVFAEESLITCPCDHKYCAQCLAEHFKSAVQSISFPPTCCYEEIPLDLAQPHLSVRLLDSYAAKRAAIENPGTVHCALLSCQASIPLENMSNGRATCICTAVTCVVCKFTAHEDACPDETQRVALLQLAVAQNLRACYRCGELYEREFRCNHMT
jgi:hypothetical protein